eukprot:jgi/Bigna1/75578/fgenesh1_pg.35_\
MTLSDVERPVKPPARPVKAYVMVIIKNLSRLLVAIVGFCQACSKVCFACAECCGTCCNKAGECCSAVISFIDNLFEEPLSGCLFMTVLLNISPLVALAYFLGTDSDQDCSDVSLFVTISIVLFVLHIAFGVYMFIHLKEKRHTEHTNDTEYERTKEFLLENPVMACYILVYIFAFVWAILGLVWSSQCIAKDDISSGSKDLAQAGEATAIVSLCFYGIGLCIFLSNLCDIDDCCASMDCTDCFGD